MEIEEKNISLYDFSNYNLKKSRTDLESIC